MGCKVLLPARDDWRALLQQEVGRPACAKQQQADDGVKALSLAAVCDRGLGEAMGRG